MNTASLVGYLVSAAISAVVTGMYHYFVASKGGPADPAAPASPVDVPAPSVPLPSGLDKHPFLQQIATALEVEVASVIRQKAGEAARVLVQPAAAASAVPAAAPKP